MQEQFALGFYYSKCLSGFAFAKINLQVKILFGFLLALLIISDFKQC